MCSGSLPSYGSLQGRGGGGGGEEGEEVQPVLGSSIQTWIFFVSFPHLLFPFLITFLALPAAVGTPDTVLVIY